LSNAKRNVMSEQVIRDNVRKIIAEQEVLKAERDYLVEEMKLIALYQLAEQKLGKSKSSKIISEATLGRDRIPPYTPISRRGWGGRDEEKRDEEKKKTPAEKAEKEMEAKIVKIATDLGIPVVNQDPAGIMSLATQIIDRASEDTPSMRTNLRTGATAKLLKLVNDAARDGELPLLQKVSGNSIQNFYDVLVVDQKVIDLVRDQAKKYTDKAGVVAWEQALTDQAMSVQNKEKVVDDKKSLLARISSAAGDVASKVTKYATGRNIASAPQTTAGLGMGILNQEFASKLRDPKTKATAVAELEALLGSMK